MIGENGSGGEGRRVLAAVMVKDARRYASTGGWGFGNFDEGSKTNTLDAKAQQTCFECHTARKDTARVHTVLRTLGRCVCRRTTPLVVTLRAQR
jgi:hypothetical protein